MTFTKLKIRQLGKVVGGGTPRSDNPLYFGGNISWITPRDLSGYQSVYIDKGYRNITELGLKESSAEVLPAGTVLFSSRAPIGYIVIAKNEMATNQGFKSIICNPEIIDNKYLYYYLKLHTSDIESIASGSTFKEVSGSVLGNFEVEIPESVEEQKNIAGIFGALDEKIELNRKMNKTLESIGQMVFKRWFADFEDKKDWTTYKLGSFFPIKTGKKDANFSSDDGKYPFFTCSQGNLKADDYSFDCSALLLAGNGDFSIKWYEGKFEAYQRTYVLEPYDKNLLGFLYFLVDHFLSDITAGHRGSVIHFLTKGMIEDFEIELPSQNYLKIKADIFTSIIQNIDFNKREIKTLSQIRDSLLPRLMSGKLRVK